MEKTKKIMLELEKMVEIEKENMPSIEELLATKDEISIADPKWSSQVATYRSSLRFQSRNLRKKQKDELERKVSAGGRGARFPLKDFMIEIFTL